MQRRAVITFASIAAWMETLEDHQAVQYSPFGCPWTHWSSSTCIDYRFDWNNNYAVGRETPACHNNSTYAYVSLIQASLFVNHNQRKRFNDDESRTI